MKSSVWSIVNQAFFLVLLVFMISGSCFSQANKSGDRLRIMFYNAENAFDIIDDTVNDDDEFLPEGLMRWNLTRYKKKISGLYKTIIAAGDWSPPDIVGFCEVESRKVLEDLVYGTYLSRYNYSIIHQNSPDRRGIDVCLIYRKDKLNIINYDYWIPVVPEVFTSRSVLYAKVLVLTDTLHLIINHWPSRRGGVLAGEELRMKIAGMVREKADSINRCSPGGAKILIMGDFNSNPNDHEMKALTSNGDHDHFLVNLSGISASGKSHYGTYRYMGAWEMIDQIIVSEKFLSDKAGISTDEKSISIFSPDFLLMKDPKYPGSSPFATYRGYKYQGGFSDHLPVMLTINQYPVLQE